MDSPKVEHPLIYSIILGLLRKGETVRVDLQHAGGRRSGILESIETAPDGLPPPHTHYRLTYEFNFDVHDRAIFTTEELEYNAFIKQTAPTIWELRINHAKRTESYGLGPI
jgi:hypothetical protein